jgi:hypothetical protein
MIINIEDKGLFYSEGSDWIVFQGIAYSKEKNSISSFMIAAPSKQHAVMGTQAVLNQFEGGYTLVSVKRLSEMLLELERNSEGNHEVNIIKSSDQDL